MKGKRGALPAQNRGSCRNDFPLSAENGNNLRGKQKQHGGSRRKQQKAAFQRKTVCGAYPAVFSCAVIEAGDGRKTLSDTDHDGGDKHRDAQDNGESGYHCVPVQRSPAVEHHDGNAGQPLPAKRGEPVGDNPARLRKHVPCRRETAHRNTRGGFLTQEKL